MNEQWDKAIYHEIGMSGNVPGDDVTLRFALRPEADLRLVLGAIQGVSGGCIHTLYIWPTDKYRPRVPTTLDEDILLNGSIYGEPGSVSANALRFSIRPVDGTIFTPNRSVIEIPYLRYDLLPAEPRQLWRYSIPEINHLRNVLQENLLVYTSCRYQGTDTAWRRVKLGTPERRDRTRAMARRLINYRKLAGEHTTRSVALTGGI